MFIRTVHIQVPVLLHCSNLHVKIDGHPCKALLPALTVTRCFHSMDNIFQCSGMSFHALPSSVCFCFVSRRFTGGDSSKQICFCFNSFRINCCFALSALLIYFFHKEIESVFSNVFQHGSTCSFFSTILMSSTYTDKEQFRFSMDVTTFLSWYLRFRILFQKIHPSFSPTSKE